MSNMQRHRYQYDRPRKAAVDSAQVVEIGDLLWLNTDDVRPASQYTYDTSLIKTQTQFKTRFYGVAMEASASGKTDEITIGTGGVWEFACAAATFEVGDFVGVDDNADGDALEDQQVIAVTDPRAAIGRVVKRYASNTTSVLVEIFPQASGNGGGIPKVERVMIQGNVDITAAGDIVVGYTFGRRVNVLL